jgi:hypothetical protein
VTETAREVAVEPAHLGQAQPSTQAEAKTLTPAARLFLASAAVMELGWLSGFGYVVYRLLS